MPHSGKHQDYVSVKAQYEELSLSSTTVAPGPVWPAAFLVGAVSLRRVGLTAVGASRTGSMSSFGDIGIY